MGCGGPCVEISSSSCLEAKIVRVSDTVVKTEETHGTYSLLSQQGISETIRM